MKVMLPWLVQDRFIQVYTFIAWGVDETIGVPFDMITYYNLDGSQEDG